MLKCQYCGRDLKNQGSKNLHERACVKNPKNDEDESPEEQPKKGNEEKKLGCKHTLILLDNRYASQKRAINDGYSAVCLKCKELV
jgi:hypothetical protein